MQTKGGYCDQKSVVSHLKLVDLPATVSSWAFPNCCWHHHWSSWAQDRTIVCRNRPYFYCFCHFVIVTVAIATVTSIWIKFCLVVNCVISQWCLMGLKGVLESDVLPCVSKDGRNASEICIVNFLTCVCVLFMHIRICKLEVIFSRGWAACGWTCCLVWRVCCIFNVCTTVVRYSIWSVQFCVLSVIACRMSNLSIHTAMQMLYNQNK
jgi:hypothetical protein